MSTSPGVRSRVVCRWRHRRSRDPSRFRWLGTQTSPQRGDVRAGFNPVSSEIRRGGDLRKKVGNRWLGLPISVGMKMKDVAPLQAGRVADDEPGSSKAPGKRTLTMSLEAAVQRKASEGASNPASGAPVAATPDTGRDDAFWWLPRPSVQASGDLDAPAASEVHSAAALGVSGPGQPLPHVERIQQSFGHHDVSGVHAHVGGEASASAKAIGAHAYATGRDVAFADASPGLELVAHEAAHVVQQRGDVALKDGLGATGDVFERHADEVAATVGRGESAEGLLDRFATPSRSSPVSNSSTVQRFGSVEPQALGDRATDAASYGIGADPNFQLTHGDIIALSGDYFAPDELMHLMRTPPRVSGIKNPSEMKNVPWVYGLVPGTRDELIYALYDFDKTDTRFQAGGVWARHSFSDDVKANVMRRYYRLAAHNDDHFPNPAGSEPADKSAGHSFRDNHEKAILAAYQAGRKDAPIDEAMIREATAQHFLTDSFAGGHVTTERTSIGAYWNAKYPDFGVRFVNKTARDIAYVLKDEGTGYPGKLPESTLEGAIRSQSMSQLNDKG